MAETHQLPPLLTRVRDWQVHAACRSLDNTYFFDLEGERPPARDRREALAKAVCRNCPVIAQCREYALAASEPYGVWGGLSKNDRDRITRRTELRRDDVPATGSRPSLRIVPV